MNNLKTLSFRNRRTFNMYESKQKIGNNFGITRLANNKLDRFKFSDYNNKDIGSCIDIFYNNLGCIEYEDNFDQEDDKCIGYTKHGDQIMKLSLYTVKFYFQNQIDFTSIYILSYHINDFVSKYHTTYKSMFNISEENRNTLLWISEEKE